jgi:hypothetical protein
LAKKINRSDRKTRQTLYKAVNHCITPSFHFCSDFD